MSFLKAKWTNLAMINYEVEPKVLEKYIPAGTEIDLWNGKCYVSLVGFLFENAKLLGLSIPLHRDFEEVNLRFYVKRFENKKWIRGVVFIKEIVPKTIIALVANSIYKENYSSLPMRHNHIDGENTFNLSYQWKYNGKWNSIQITSEKKLIEIESNSHSEFITEHYFGYTKVNNNITFEYEVKHPRWFQYKVADYIIDVDFKATYGQEFEFLNNQKPVSVLLAKGSEVTVENKRKI